MKFRDLLHKFNTLMYKLRDAPVPPKLAKFKKSFWYILLVVILVNIGVTGTVSAFKQSVISPVDDNALVKAQQDMNKNKVLAEAPKNINPSDYSGDNTETPEDLATLIKQNKESKEKMAKSLRGQVSIPAINLHVPIMEGVSKSALAWGAGTAKPYEEMGKGNYAISAHNCLGLDVNPALLFTPIQSKVAGNELDTKYIAPTLGMDIYSLDKNNVYQYQIVKREIVDSKDVRSNKVLEDSRVNEISPESHSPIITLTTCYIQSPVGVHAPRYRIIVTGRLVNTTPRDKFSAITTIFRNV